MTEPVAGRDGWVALGMAVSATSAAVSSFSGLRSLAEVAGWAPEMAWLFPLTVDAYAMTATRVWLAASTRSDRARRFARSNAVGAILLSLCGNAAWHLVAAQLIAVSWPIVLAVGTVPPLVLGLVAHLAVLRTQVDGLVAAETTRTEAMSTTALPALVSPVTGPSTATAVQPLPVRPALESGDGPRTGTKDGLYEAARAADAAYRLAHGSRPITRDALRQELRIGGSRATAVLRRLKEEQGEPGSVSSD